MSVSTKRRTRLWCPFGLMPGQGVVAANADVDHRAMTTVDNICEGIS